MLPKLAEGAENWTIEVVPTLDKRLLWLWFTDENRAYSALVGAGDDGALSLIIASLPADSDQADVRAAFYAVISDWVE